MFKNRTRDATWILTMITRLPSCPRDGISFLMNDGALSNTTDILKKLRAIILKFVGVSAAIQQLSRLL
jgi:hypothetical protein